jgi:hypothetical protein
VFGGSEPGFFRDLTLTIMVQLPQELVDWVIDYLHDDPDELYACSLVCRDWLPSSRYHKFGTILLQSSITAPESFETCPIAAEYVRNLVIIGSKLLDFPNCINLRQLGLRSCRTTFDVLSIPIPFSERTRTGYVPRPHMPRPCTIFVQFFSSRFPRNTQSLLEI